MGTIPLPHARNTMICLPVWGCWELTRKFRLNSIREIYG